MQLCQWLLIEINLLGKNKPGGGKFETPAEVTKFILDDAKIGLVPFSAFDSVENPTWYRLSVGTCTREEVGEAIYNLEKSLEKIPTNTSRRTLLINRINALNIASSLINNELQRTKNR